jgi:hypothetical protein
LPDLRDAAPWVPGSVAEWFQRACARDVQQRFQSADELIEGLDLALGVSTGAYPRQQSSPEVRLDTLRGHAPPIHHSIPRAPSDSGEFAKGGTHVLSTDQTLLPTHRPEAPRTSDPDELMFAPSSRKRWIIGGLFALVVLGGGAALLLGQDNGVPPTREVAVQPSAQIASAAVGSPAPTAPATAPTTAPSTAAIETPPNTSVPRKSGAPRAPAPKSAVAASKAVSKGISASPVSPRSTNTDMGF